MGGTGYLIIGANGQLGKALQAQYPNATAVDMAELDISDKQAVNSFDWSGVKVILNAAAYTNVDEAETAEGRTSAWQANAVAPANLAQICSKNDITLVHISTDYVFDGRQDLHAEDEPFCPLSVYGASKAAGDIAVATTAKHYILRTSWVIGNGKNFVRTMLGLGQKGVSPSVVSDQIGRLTFTSTLVSAINHLLSANSPFGTYNVSNDGEPASWAQITREIFQDGGFSSSVTNVTTAEYYKGKENIAPRPLKSSLNLAKIKAAGFNPNDWQEDLKHYITKQLQAPRLDAVQGTGEE